ncbi:regulatory protein RecX [Arthrobacter zhangbolii]|uniref:regulatory protein RecX n=1 Tax=Arthrobacter zhangbolii TaxID=2886936 RepID=UPI00311A9D96
MDTPQQNNRQQNTPQQSPPRSGTGQDETLAQLRQRLADIQAGTAQASADDPAGAPANERNRPGRTAGRRKAAGSKDSSGESDPEAGWEAFKEDGFGEEATADEPWAEADAAGISSGRRRNKRGKPGGTGGSGQQADAETLTPEEAYSEAKAIVLRQVTASPKSRKQLETKLAERDIPAESAAAVLDRFEEVQLVDDAEFAQLWVRSRSQSKSLARGALRRELAEKGIAPDLAAEALEQVSDEDELEAARELARRKLQRSADLADRTVRDKQTRRLVGILARKGYSPSLGFRVASEVIAAVREERGDSV